MTNENIEMRLKALEDQMNSLLHADGPFSENFTIQARKELLLHAPSLQIEAERVNIDGEVFAKLSYSKALTWVSGQDKLKLIHKNRGFPVIVSLKGALAEVRLFIDHSDNFWYLHGHSSGNKSLEVQVVCVGKVGEII